MFLEIIPNKVEFPFYVSEFPFTKTTSELEWLRKVVGKEKSTIHKGREPDVKELWDELSHDYKVYNKDPTLTIKDHKKRMHRLKLTS